MNDCFPLPEVFFWPGFILRQLFVAKDIKYLDQNEMLKRLEEYGVKKSPSWAEQARFRKTGPRFCKIGGRIFYKSDWIEQWLNECEEVQ